MRILAKNDYFCTRKREKRMKLSDKRIIEGFCSFDERITKKYFYGYCRQAYLIFDHRYQLRGKTGLDFYSLAHDYYIHLLSLGFRPLLDKPKGTKLSSWMIRGFHFVVLDALKVYNKEFENQAEEASDVVLDYVLSSDREEDLLPQVAEAVSLYYLDPVMSNIARMVFFEGYLQREAAERLGMSPAAVHQRYKRMMEEVVTPFVVEHYGMGLYTSRVVPKATRQELGGLPPMFEEKIISVSYMQKERITPSHISMLQPNEIFVFGSNLQGIHAGGAARMAHLCFGAVMGNGVGMQGQSYAIPTMQGGVETIRPYVDEFIEYARQHPTERFLVTPIGCGIAGFDAVDIAPLFDAAREIENISLPAVFWDILLA